MGFREEYIKNEIKRGVDSIEGACGIEENISLQWENRSKAVGLFNNNIYVFGATPDFSVDHIYIINKMEELIGEIRFGVFIHESNGKVCVLIRPMHPDVKPEGEFEKKIIQEIVKECRAAFFEMPFRGKMQVDIESVILDCDDIKMTRSTNLEELEQQLNHLVKP